MGVMLFKEHLILVIVGAGLLDGHSKLLHLRLIRRDIIFRLKPEKFYYI
jgi:hypothetical protein